MDLAGLAAVVVATNVIAKPVVDTAIETYRSIFGEASKELGGLAHDKVEMWRFVNRIKQGAIAARMMKKKGIPPRVLPPSFLLPMSLSMQDVEDETLQKAWASLLASAVQSDIFQHPRLHQTLRQLTGGEVKILDRLGREEFGEVLLICPEKSRLWTVFTTWEEIIPGLTREEESFYVSNLLELDMVRIDDVDWHAVTDSDTFSKLRNRPDFKAVEASMHNPVISPGIVRMTETGLTLFEACSIEPD